VGRLELVDVAGHLQRADQEVVPHVLEGNLHPQLLRQRQGLADLRLRARVGVVVGHLLVDHGGHQQDRTRPVGLGIAQGRLQPLPPASPHRRVGVRQGVLPVDRVHHAVDRQPRPVAGGEHLPGVQCVGARHLHAVEAQLLEQLELLLHPAPHPDHAVLDRLLELALLPLGRQRGAPRQGTTQRGRRAQELSPGEG
jgi:hypothetical protein